MLNTNSITTTGTAYLTDWSGSTGDCSNYGFLSLNAFTYSCSASGTISSLVTGTVSCANTKSLSLVGDTGRYNMYRFNKYMKAGTYDAYVSFYREASSGKFHLYIDGVEKGTAIDCYYSGTPDMQSVAITNFTITGNKYHTVDVRGDDKNDSSAGYGLIWTSMWLYPHI